MHCACAYLRGARQVPDVRDPQHYLVIMSCHCLSCAFPLLIMSRCCALVASCAQVGAQAYRGMPNRRDGWKGGVQAASVTLFDS